jgi:uncharacterized membrane protein
MNPSADREHASSRGQNLKIKTYIFLALMVSIGSIGNTMLDKGMKALGAVDISSRLAVWQGFLLTFKSSTIWFGILCMLLFMVCHMLVLSWADYSFVMPFSAITYALVPLLGFFWLHEQVSPARWAGIALIMFGVFLISRTPPSTTQSSAAARQGTSS